jgi:hypothetical protein
MWMVPPAYLCTQHLLGEHGELHKFLPSWRRKIRIDGRIAGNAIEPMSYFSRHEVLAEEMIQRGMRHHSPLAAPDFSYLPIEQQAFKIDVARNLLLLIERCPACLQRYYLNIEVPDHDRPDQERSAR